MWWEGGGGGSGGHGPEGEGQRGGPWDRFPRSGVGWVASSPGGGGHGFWECPGTTQKESSPSDPLPSPSGFPRRDFPVGGRDHRIRRQIREGQRHEAGVLLFRGGGRRETSAGVWRNKKKALCFAMLNEDPETVEVADAKKKAASQQGEHRRTRAHTRHTLRQMEEPGWGKPEGRPGACDRERTEGGCLSWRSSIRIADGLDCTQVRVDTKLDGKHVIF